MINLILAALLLTSPIKNKPTDKPAFNSKDECDVCSDTAWMEYLVCLDKMGVEHTVACTKAVLKLYTICEAKGTISL